MIESFIVYNKTLFTTIFSSFYPYLINAYEVLKLSLIRMNEDFAIITIDG